MRLLLAIAVLLLAAPPAFAQGNPGPFGGLFGRTPNRTSTDYTVLDLRGSGGVQWDGAVFEQTPDLSGELSSGTSGQSALSASYETRSERFGMRAGTNVDYRQALTVNPVGGTSVDGGLELSGRLTTRVSAETSLNYRYSPYFQYYPSFAWLDSGLVVPGLPYVATATSNHSGEARVSGSYQYSKNSTLHAAATRAQTLFPNSPDSDLTTTGFDGGWDHRLNRSLTLRLGYGRSRMSQSEPGAPDLIYEEIDAGIDFNKALPLSPRTTMAFSTSTSVVRGTEGDPVYRLNGSFDVSHRFRRTWEVSFDANRGTEFMPGFAEPVFSDTLGFSVGGQLARRVEWMSSIYGSRGQIGFDSAVGKFVTAGATTQLNVALTRHVGVYSQYGLYHHNVPSQASTIPVIHRLSRQSFSVGVSAWIPVFSRGRTSSDSR